MRLELPTPQVSDKEIEEVSKFGFSPMNNFGENKVLINMFMFAFFYTLYI